MWSLHPPQEQLALSFMYLVKLIYYSLPGIFCAIKFKEILKKYYKWMSPLINFAHHKGSNSFS